MKKILYYTILLVMCILPSSCSDLLEEESRNDLEKKYYMNNANEAETVLLGVYRNMVTDNLYGFNMSILLNLATDCEQVEGSNNENFRIVPTNSFTTSQLEIQQTWSELYNGIYNANDFMERLSSKVVNYTDEDKIVANIFYAEARGLRALYYFELVRRYGNVVLMTNTEMSKMHPKTFVQSTPQKVYEFIEEDLKYAIDHLPYAVDDVTRNNSSFRFSKGAAMGLLTKVYATWAGYPVNDKSKWEKAAKTAKTLIESGKHALLADYEQLWYNAGKGAWDPTESLLEVSFYSPTATGGAADPCGRIGKWNGVKTTSIAGKRGSCAANVKVVHTFVLKWRNKDLAPGETYQEKNVKDKRLLTSIANYQYADNKVLYSKGKNDTDGDAQRLDADPTKKLKEKQNYTPAKWDIEKYCSESNRLINNDKSNMNWYILRYADVLLLYAEALNEWKQGPTEEAYEAINMVRRRGYGLSTSNSSKYDLKDLSVDTFREAVQNERAYELAFEGHRRLDLVRWGIYYETVMSTNDALFKWWEPMKNDAKNPTPNYAAAFYTTKNKHELNPIPLRDMELCEQFVQNPGWEK